MAAYKGRCAITRLPESRLLDAAHIIADGDGDLGQPVVRNGILLSKLHHAAFDRHLIGIDADYRLPVRSGEHTSELQSLMSTSYAVFCLTKTTHLLSTHPPLYH